MFGEISVFIPDHGPTFIRAVSTAQPGLCRYSNKPATGAATFVLAAGLVAVVRRTTTTSRPGSAEGVVRQWLRGWAAVRQHPVLRPLVMVMAIVGLGEGFLSALLAPWMSRVAGGGSTALGVMLSLQALGGILGGLFVVRCAGRWAAVRSLLPC